MCLSLWDSPPALIPHSLRLTHSLFLWNLIFQYPAISSLYHQLKTAEIPITKRSKVDYVGRGGGTSSKVFGWNLMNYLCYSNPICSHESFESPDISWYFIDFKHATVTQALYEDQDPLFPGT